MRYYVVKRYWDVEEVVVKAKNKEHAAEVADSIPAFSFPDLDAEEVELLVAPTEKENKEEK